MLSHIIGIMSGSSLDGLDMALCRFDVDTEIKSWSIIDAMTLPFPPTLLATLKNAHQLSGHDLMKLDADFGKYIGEEVNVWIQQNKLTVDCIASHGHTIFHEPLKGFTTQIGSGAHIAFATGTDTITTFRSADVAAGGQGAPFAPVADQPLFPGYDAYLNLGGIANINVRTHDGAWKAWDIGPCNQALNYLAAQEGLTFDKDGILASQGIVIHSVVETLTGMYPFDHGKPKGLSNAEVKNTWINYFETSTDQVIDLLASTTEAIAALILQHLTPITTPPLKMLVTGGGAHNAFLMHKLQTFAQRENISIELPTAQIIDFKECALMAYLGLLTLHSKPFGIHRITGASADTIGGAIFKAKR